MGARAMAAASIGKTAIYAIYERNIGELGRRGNKIWFGCGFIYMNRHRASVRGPPHTVMWGQDSDPGKEILLRVPSLTDIRYWLLFVQWAVVCRAEDVVDCNTVVR